MSGGQVEAPEALEERVREPENQVGVLSQEALFPEEADHICASRQGPGLDLEPVAKIMISSQSHPP